MKNKIGGILLIILLSCLIICLGFKRETKNYPQDVYLVYLDGQKIGLIQDKQKLLNMIDEEQASIKNKYKVDKVYPPNGLKIVRYVTYDSNIMNEETIYEKIKNLENFTIKGYKVTIKSAKEDVEPKYLYLLDEKYFDDAINNSIKVFIDEKAYNNYINDTQESIKDTGEIIESVEIEESITIKETLISVNEEILTSVSEVSRYLMFGTLEKQETYKVKAGEDVETIAYKKELGVDEFLIANPDIKSAATVLSEGQEVNVGLINPMFTLVYITELVEDQVNAYTTEVTYDPQISIGSTYVKQQGEDGLNRVTFQMKYVNGKIEDAIKIQATTLVPTVNKVIIKGGANMSGSGYGSTDIWYWPTITPYKITDTLRYRGKTFHDAIDIAGCGQGSPIFAANDGIVYESGYNSTPGNHVRINHQNGYKSSYCHLDQIFVKVGQVVSKGEKIGTMGRTGVATGTHLHYSVYYNGAVINPLNLNYR